MAIETNRQPYSQIEEGYYPEWWEKWLKKNLKKQTRLFSKRTK
jgi:hypothetical protein